MASIDNRPGNVRRVAIDDIPTAYRDLLAAKANILVICTFFNEHEIAGPSGIDRLLNGLIIGRDIQGLVCVGIADIAGVALISAHVPHHVPLDC